MKHYGKTAWTFTAGMATAALLTTTILPAAAAGGQVSFGQVGVRLFGQQQFAAGASYAAPNGQNVPSSITYTDAAGGKTNYLAVRQIADLLDADVGWDAASSSVEFAPDHAGNVSNVTITQGADDGSDFQTVPTYGQKIGAYEELDASQVDAVQNPKAFPVSCLKNTRVQYTFGFPTYTDSFDYIQGEYLAYTVTNNSQSVVFSRVYHEKAVSYGERESFASVAVQPGQTLTRVFRVSKDANPMDTLSFDVRNIVGEARDASYDVTVSLEQYISQEQYEQDYAE